MNKGKWFKGEIVYDKKTDSYKLEIEPKGEKLLQKTLAKLRKGNYEMKLDKRKKLIIIKEVD